MGPGRRRGGGYRGGAREGVKSGAAQGTAPRRTLLLPSTRTRTHLSACAVYGSGGVFSFSTNTAGSKSTDAYSRSLVNRW